MSYITSSTFQIVVVRPDVTIRRISVDEYILWVPMFCKGTRTKRIVEQKSSIFRFGLSNSAKSSRNSSVGQSGRQCHQVVSAYIYQM